MQAQFKKNTVLQRTNPSMLNHSILSGNKVGLSPSHFISKNKESTSTSPRRESITPRKDRHKKSASKLFQKARSNDYGETYLISSTSGLQRFPSAGKAPSYRQKMKQNSKELRQPQLKIEKVFTYTIDGAPSLSQIINQFNGESKLGLPNITQNSEQMLEIHSKLQLSESYKTNSRPII